ncbi:SdrD B-like domain-containing protein [Candidatus Omnitrophota bacterium]
MNRLLRKKRTKKLLVIIPLISFLSITILPFTEGLTRLEASEFGMSADFLIQTGISFYDQGRIVDAMGEFKKALAIDPGSTVAKVFLRRIQKELYIQEPPSQKPKSKFSAIKNALDQAELEYGVEKALRRAEQVQPQARKRAVYEPITQLIPDKPGIPIAQTENVILLNDELRVGQVNILLELEIYSSVLLKGNNIKRFLNITTQKIEISRYDQDSIVVTSKGIGGGIFHVWDDSGRWTFDFQGKHRKFFGTFRDKLESMDEPIGLSKPFKFTYGFDWSSFHTGRRIDTTQRQSLSFSQSFNLRGETPYGNFYSYLSARRLNKQHEIESLGMGLTEGRFGGLKDINLRWFDFTPMFSAYKFPSADLRGAMINAPMFNDKINYTAFWGGLPEGNYTHLSPGLGNTREAYLQGIGIRYRQSEDTSYKIYYAHTNGSELSKPVLTNNAFGLGASYNIGNLRFNSDVAYDGAEHISYASRASLRLRRGSLSLSFREEDRDFVSPLGGSASGGQTSLRLGATLRPTDDISISQNFTAIRDRNLYNLDDPKRPNYTFNNNVSWKLDPFTTAIFGYSRIDNKGSVSPSISETKSFGLRKRIFFIKKINTYLDYSSLRNKYYSGTSSNYDQNTLRGGLGFQILGNLHFSLNESINYTKNRITNEDATSSALETSLSYYSRILNSPFYGRMRVSYRNEEQSSSSLSFLSGQDRLEFSGELDYRPNPYINAYLSGRVANVWPESEGAGKRLDAEVRYGARLNWDTGVRWNTKGHIYGFVFYDDDADSFKDEDEKGVEGVVLTATTKKSDTTNAKGFYLIKDIIGKQARVAIDLNSIPRGYNITTPLYSDVYIKHGDTHRVDFGITTRVEIVGVVFIDTNGNNKFDRGEEGVSGVVIVIDGTERIVTDQGGQYLFRKIEPGKHTLKIDLRTLPTKYIPKVPLKTEFMLEQGSTFFYHVPLKVAAQRL